MYNVKHSQDRETGFTLVEILVGMAIVVVLISIAVPIFLNQRKKASFAAVKSEVENAAIQWQRDYYDSMRVWNNAFVTGLNTPNATAQLKGVSSGDKACVEGYASGTNQYYSYVINTKKGSKTNCAGHPDM